MATQSLVVTKTAKNVKTSFSTNLTVGTSYLFQNRGTTSIEIFERSASPAAAQYGMIIKPEEFFSITVGALGIWVRIPSASPADESRLVSSES